MRYLILATREKTRVVLKHFPFLSVAINRKRLPLLIISIKILAMSINRILTDISKTFSGKLETTNKDILEMREEMFSVSVPKPSEDGANLRKDSQKICGDFRKAYNEKIAVL